MGMKDVNSYEITKVQPQGVVWHLLNFPLLISPWVVSKSVVYKNKRVHVICILKIQDFC